ncbi:aldehyde dehydrogenase-like protein [Xylariaceae sp. FL0255]|nr:aldehyde dehydrogenase-like protein [Xylariaceae sp. FL0255]
MASTSEKSSVKLDFTNFSNVIDGKCVAASPGMGRCTVNPSTLEKNPEVPITTCEDVDRAVSAARKVAGAWASLSWKDRQTTLSEYIDAVEANSEGFAKVVVREQGKTLNEARGEVYLGVKCLRGTIALELPEGEELDHNEQRRVVKRYTPLGVAVGIVPRLVAALLTGNTFILKPSPFTPYCSLKGSYANSLKLAELGTHFLPPGVLQALSGEDDLGPLLTSHAGVNVFTFAGSIATGKRIMESCSKTMKRVILELGGNDPTIVCPDVDIATTAPAIACIAFANSGQICMSPKRVYVHESIYDDFLAAMVEYANKLKLTTDEVNAIGPISNKTQFESVKSLLADAKADKLAIAAGGTQPPADSSRPGFYLLPTLIDNPPDTARVVVEEAFGPIVPVMRWSNEKEVIERANDSEYGLGASVWSRNATQANRMARELQAGSIWINTHSERDAEFPFGGMKNSGIGHAGGLEGLASYCNLQTIWSKLD